MKPYTWEHVRTVRRQVCGNLLPKGSKAPQTEPTFYNHFYLRGQGHQGTHQI